MPSDTSSDPAPERSALFRAACRIGDHLCDTAVTHDHRSVNWLGRCDIVDDPIVAQYSVRSRALGPELYAGSAGVALFLTDLHAATGDPRLARVAAAALHRSVAYLRQSTLPLHPFSFFAGHAGVLCAVTRLLALRPTRALHDDAAWLAEVVSASGPSENPDVIAGMSGGILALIDSGRQARDPRRAKRYLDLAQQCGRAICEAAHWSGDACSWPPHADAARPSAPALAGVAHGGAGTALALLALYRVASEEVFLATARGALAYTDDLFNGEVGSWVDTRAPHEPGRGKARGRFQSGWCHGSTGILLVRQYAAEVDAGGREAHEGYARAAAGSVVRSLRDFSGGIVTDATLCHGVLGHSEALTTYAHARGDAALEAECLALVSHLSDRYPHPAEWPSGVNAGGYNPSLMIGLAGIGYHLLRLSGHRAGPSVLSLLAA